MQFGECTYKEILEYAERGHLVVVPTGCMEQQGPHLPVDHDTFIIENLCLMAADKAMEDYGIPSKELSLREIDKKNFIRSIDWFYKNYIDPSLENKDPLSKEEIKQWKYIRSLQERYCRENGL